MVWEMLLYLYVLYSPDWHYRSTMPTFLFLYGAGFAIIHSLVHFELGFKLHYVALCLICIPRMYKYYIKTKEVAARRLAYLYIATLCLGALFWFLDRIFCDVISLWYINPQGHAWWHILMGLNAYFENTFLMYCRGEQLGWQSEVAHLFGFLPYVKIQKPKKQQWQWLLLPKIRFLVEVEFNNHDHEQLYLLFYWFWVVKLSNFKILFFLFILERHEGSELVML